MLLHDALDLGDHVRADVVVVEDDLHAVVIQNCYRFVSLRQEDDLQDLAEEVGKDEHGDDEAQLDVERFYPIEREDVPVGDGGGIA